MATIPSGQQSGTFTVTVPDTYVLNGGETRTQSAGTGIQATVTSGYTTLDIEGTLTDTASGARAIRANVPNGQLLVGAAGRIQASNGDAVQAQSATGRFDLTNAGQIIAASTAGQPTVGGTNPGTAYALNYNAVTGAANAPLTDYTSGGVVTNGAAGNTAALIRSDSGDAIRLGSHQTLVNYGTINGNGPVNDAATNNSFNQTGNTSTTQTYDVSRGVRINQSGATSDRIDNYGTITGAQHGVDVGVANATGLVFNNYAGGQIVGRNGSGIGADTTGISPTTVTVTNAGTIRGAYAPTYDRAGYATIDGDGDGVDIDGSATIVNGTSGVIEGTGAGGFDSNGRANNSEGISIGGGSVVNDGTIRGATYGIVVNNDSNPDGSRGGSAATSIVNGVGGQITGQDGYAIRLENKTGSATVDNDTLVNAGTITGTGRIPSGTVLRQDGNPDPGTVGTLDGVTYTAANAGSARFIRGDGSAIQTGEGADTVSNYGTITGNTGRALNLEGGNDTLNLYTGMTVTGRLDGGAGTDTLNLRLDDRPTVAASGPGTLGANSGATTGALGNVVNFEALSVQGGTWTIQDAQTYTSGISIGANAGLTIGASGSLAGSGAIGFATLSGAATARLTLATGAQPNGVTFASTLANFGTGSQLDLAGLTNATVSYSSTSSLLTVLGTSGGTAVTQMYSVAGPTSTAFVAQDDGTGGTLITVCYASGTRILTVSGEVAVENLREGDHVVTASGEARPIRWIGHRRTDCTRHPRPEAVWPVRVRADAFGAGLPKRDLHLSPDHAVRVSVLDEVLIPIKHLLNDATVAQVPVAEITYWHVELDSHDILVADGLPAESFLDTGVRGFFANADSFTVLHPDFTALSLDDFCLPLVQEGPIVDAVRTRLLARAARLGWRLTAEDDLHIVADGVTVYPERDGAYARFTLPAEAGTVRLVSRSFVPERVRVGAGDGRRLGVALRGLAVEDALGVTRSLPIAHPLLREGFSFPQGPEGDAWRWTNGDAVVPSALWAGATGAVVLNVVTAPDCGTVQAWQAPLPSVEMPEARPEPLRRAG